MNLKRSIEASLFTEPWCFEFNHAMSSYFSASDRLVGLGANITVTDKDVRAFYDCEGFSPRCVAAHSKFAKIQIDAPQRFFSAYIEAFGSIGAGLDACWNDSAVVINAVPGSDITVIDLLGLKDDVSISDGRMDYYRAIAKIGAA